MKRAEHVGVVVARGMGVLLILEAVSIGTGAIESFFPGATSGWTSYSQSATTSTTSYFVSVTVLLPVLVQILIGSGIILFSRTIGRWLALGLKEQETESREQ